MGLYDLFSPDSSLRGYTIKYRGEDVLIPDVPEFIKEIDENNGMKVLPIPGFFDKADEV